jgi:hypothetical protein
MTQDEIIEMAKEAGINIDMWEKLCDYDDVFGYGIEGIHENLEAFARLVAEKEREACVKACEEVWLDTVEAQTHNDKCVKAIRAMGQP